MGHRLRATRWGAPAPLERGHRRVGDGAVHHGTAGLLTPPAVILNRHGSPVVGAVGAAARAERINGMPARPLTADPTRGGQPAPPAMLGRWTTPRQFMPLRDPAGPTRIVIDADDDPPSANSYAGLGQVVKWSRL